MKTKTEIINNQTKVFFLSVLYLLLVGCAGGSSPKDALKTDMNKPKSDDNKSEQDKKPESTKKKDTTPPVITLLGNNPANLKVGDTYTDAGAKAVDGKDGDITADIAVSNPVDTTKAGTYTITYNVSDSAGNRASATRVVVVGRPDADYRFPWDHGRLMVSTDGSRMLRHTDGTGFFWMADTAWNLYMKTKEDIDLYMKDRAAKKFTIILVVALHMHKSENSSKEAPFVEYNIKSPNEEYWKHIDYMISKAEELGMYVGLLPVWHHAVRDGMLKNPDDAKIFGQWIANRYKSRQNIVWIIGGDTPVDSPRPEDNRAAEGMSVDEEKAIWNALGSAIDGIDSNHLITFHPLLTIPSKLFDSPEWLDFNMVQSARESTKHSIKHIQDALKEGLAVVDGESLYENFGLVRRGGEADRATEYQVRDDAYSQIFAGAFGNTYGHGSIYRFWEKEAPADCSRWACDPNMTWRKALDAPGGRQMQYVTELMQSRPIVGRVPDQSLIVGTPPAVSLDGIVATRGDGYAMIYSAYGKDINIQMGKISADKVIAWWYDPRTGKASKIGEFENSGTHTFDPPGEPSEGPVDKKELVRKGNDWVLVLDDASKEYGVPGDRK